MSSPLLTTGAAFTMPSVMGADELSDAELLARLGECGSILRQVNATTAVLTQELAVRSSRELGHQGLAARNGLNSPEKLVQKLTGVSYSDARELTTAGAVLGEVQQGRSEWLAPVAEAVNAGTLSVAGAAAITNGLGSPSATVTADELLDAATELVAHAVTSTPEETARAARGLRCHLDVASVTDLEQHRRSKRSLKWFETPDGMTRVTAALDPESAAVFVGALATALSPRRGGPRFVDPDEITRAEAMIADSRTNEQLAVDTLVEIVQLAGRAANSPLDHNTVFGEKSPAVRVHVEAAALTSGDGFAYFEGQSAPVSISTAERHICTSGIQPILFDTGSHLDTGNHLDRDSHIDAGDRIDISALFEGNRPIDAGRTQRLHSTRQRTAITAFWNGCAFGNCDKPPQFTEVHHIHKFDGQNTTLANGISLCRFHHMELHANAWSITVHRDHSHWLTPPPTLDPAQTPILMRSKSPLQRAG